MHDDIEYSIARALLATHPTLYATLVELVRAGQTTTQIMARVNRITRGSLTANAIETTIIYLRRNRL
jgi:hypothetical protein